MSHGQQTTTRLDAESGKRYCGHCGAHVSIAFARVFGNNHDEVYACPDCATMRELRNGLARKA